VCRAPFPLPPQRPEAAGAKRQNRAGTTGADFEEDARAVVATSWTGTLKSTMNSQMMNSAKYTKNPAVDVVRRNSANISWRFVTGILGTFSANEYRLG
jgi:hypothetical protein